MRFSTVSTLSFLALALPFAANGASHGAPGARHELVARRANANNLTLATRDDKFSGMRFTYYDVGL